MEQREAERAGERATRDGAGLMNGVGREYRLLVSDSPGTVRDTLLATPLLITTYRSKHEQSFRAMLFLWFPNLA